MNCIYALQGLQVSTRDSLDPEISEEKRSNIYTKGLTNRRPARTQHQLASGNEAAAPAQPPDEGGAEFE